MFDIYIRNYMNGNSIQTSETLMLSIPIADPTVMIINKPILKLEMGTVGAFDFEVEPESPYYDAFMHMRTLIRIVYKDSAHSTSGTTLFFGRVLTINNTLLGNRKIRCEDALAFLNDVQYPGVDDKNRTSISTETWINKVLNYYNQMVGSDSPKVMTFGEVPGQYSTATAAQRIKSSTQKHESTSWTDVKSIFDNMASGFGGYWRTRFVEGRIYLDWLNTYFNPVVNPAPIELGKNLLDLNNSYEVDNIFTAVIPIGQDDDGKPITIAGYKTDKHESNYVLVSDLVNKGICSDAELNVGYHRKEDYANSVNNYGMIYRTVSFPNADTQAQLWDWCIDWMKNNYLGVVKEFTIKAFDLHQIGNGTQMYLVGDQVTVKYPKYVNGQSMIVSEVMTVKTITYDLFNPENLQLTIGYPLDMLDHEYGDKRTKANKSGKGSGGGGGKSKDGRDANAIAIRIHPGVRMNFIDNKQLNLKYGDEAFYSYTPEPAGIITKYQYAITDPTTGKSYTGTYALSTITGKDGKKYTLTVCNDGIFLKEAGGNVVLDWVHPADNGTIVFNGYTYDLYDEDPDSDHGIVQFITDAGDTGLYGEVYHVPDDVAAIYLAKEGRSVAKFTTVASTTGGALKAAIELYDKEHPALGAGAKLKILPEEIFAEANDMYAAFRGGKIIMGGIGSLTDELKEHIELKGDLGQIVAVTDKLKLDAGGTNGSKFSVKDKNGETGLDVDLATKITSIMGSLGSFNFNTPSNSLIIKNKSIIDPESTVDVDTVLIDGSASKISLGPYESGGGGGTNYMVRMNDTVSYIDDEGNPQTRGGFITAMDFSIPTIPSFHTKFAAIDHLVAEKADIVELNAVKANIQDLTVNKLNATEFTADKIHAKLQTLSGLTVVGVTANTITSHGGVYASSFNISGTEGTVNVGNEAIAKFGEATYDGDTVTIPTFSLNGNHGPDLTFKKPASGTGAWSNGVYTVTSPGGTTIASTALKDIAVKSADEEVDITNVLGNYFVSRTFKVTQTDGINSGDTGFEQRVMIDATKVYQNGKNAVGLKLQPAGSSDVEASVSVDTSNNANKSYSVSSIADIVYDSSSHKYTATSQTKLGSTTMASSMKTGGTEAYSAGVTSGKNAVGLKISNAGTANASVAVNTENNSTKSYTSSTSCSITYSSSTHKYVGLATSKLGSTTMNSVTATSGTEAYEAGITDGRVGWTQGTFTAADITLQGSAHADITPIGEKVSSHYSQGSAATSTSTKTQGSSASKCVSGLTRYGYASLYTTKSASAPTATGGAKYWYYRSTDMSPTTMYKAGTTLTYYPTTTTLYNAGSLIPDTYKAGTAVTGLYNAGTRYNGNKYYTKT